MKAMKTMKSGMSGKQGGFTLIEIAIVLVIIGLLLGGVLQGQQLIENSRVRSATNDFNGIAAAMFSYQDRYGRLPGADGPLATLQTRGGAWENITLASDPPTGTITIAAADTFDGTGDAGAFFQHLRAAGFISGNPADTALPQNPFGGVIGITSAGVLQDANANALAGNKICMSNVIGSAAIALDTQLDDGVPNTGRFRASEGAIPAATAIGAYNENNTYIVCFRL